MSEQDINLDKDADLKEVVDERSVLTKRADTLGISYSNNIGLETLRNRINNKLEEVEKTKEDAEKKDSVTSKILQARKDATKLIRVNITSMENTKNNMSGEIFTVSNNVVGTIKRYVPFGVDWHVESIILDTLRDKEYQRFGSEKTSGGQTVRRAKSSKAYAIQELPPLTNEELLELKKSQLARNTIEK